MTRTATDHAIAAMLDTFRRAPIERDYSDKDLRAALGSSPPLEKMKMAHTPTPWVLMQPGEHIDGCLGSAHGYYISSFDGRAETPVCQFYNLHQDREKWTEEVTPKINAEANAHFVLTAVNSHASNLALITELVGALDWCGDVLNDENYGLEEKLHLVRNRIHSARAKASHGAGT